MLAMWHIDNLPWKYQYFSTFGKFRHFPPKSKCSDVKTNKFYKTWTKLGNNSRPPRFANSAVQSAETSILHYKREQHYKRQ